MPDRRPTARRAVLALLLVGAFHTAGAQSLSEAWQAALQHDPEHAAAAAARDAAEENNQLARSLFRPKAVLQATGGHLHTSWDASVQSPSALSAPALQSELATLATQFPALATALSTPGAFNVPDNLSGTAASALILLDQPIINGEASAQARQLRAGALAGQSGYQAQRHALALRLARSYFDLLQAQDTVDTLTAQEALMRREQQSAQARFDEGRAKITDVREAQAKADLIAAQLVGARAQHENALAQFRELTGIDHPRPHLPRADLEPQPPLQTLEALQTEALARSPLLEARRQQLAAAEAKSDQHRWSSHVKLSARAAAGEGRLGGGASPVLLGALTPPERAGGYFVGLQLTMPLYTGGGLDAQRRQALAKQQEAEAQLEAAQRDIRLQIEQAWRGQQSAAEQVRALQTALHSAELQERAALTGREVGVRTQSDVLAAQTQTFDTRRRLNQARYAYELSRIALHAAIGDLTEAHLQEIDQDLVAPENAGSGTAQPPAEAAAPTPKTAIRETPLTTPAEAEARATTPLTTPAEAESQPTAPAAEQPTPQESIRIELLPADATPTAAE